MEDRTTYRSYTTTRLIEVSKHEPNPELAVALGERLEDLDYELDGRVAEVKDEADDMRREAMRLEDEVCKLGVEIDKLEMMLDQRQIEIADLQAQIEQLQKGN